MAKTRGILVSFEGVSLSGKSALIEIIKNHYKATCQVCGCSCDCTCTVEDFYFPDVKCQRGMGVLERFESDEYSTPQAAHLVSTAER